MSLLEDGQLLLLKMMDVDSPDEKLSAKMEIHLQILELAIDNFIELADRTKGWSLHYNHRASELAALRNLMNSKRSEWNDDEKNDSE